MKNNTSKTFNFLFVIISISTALVLATIIHLTRQSGPDTISTQNMIVSLFPELFPKHYHNALWLYLGLNSARKMAHIYEFGALGFFMTLLIITSPIGKRLRNNSISTRLIFFYSVIICGFSSFCDQIHKTFIVYRHFDSHDLVLDAIGYITATAFICTLYYIKKHPISLKPRGRLTLDHAI